ncbi:MAG: serine/threonine-protein kinase [Pseudomonadota bacterium]
MSDFGDRLAEEFAALVELPVDARQPRLDALAEQAPALAKELASLLAAHDAEQGFLSPPDSRAVSHLLEADDRDQMPDRAGNWSLISELGRGGLGVVYLAERSGDDYEQKAAIKLIKRGMDSDAILRRFQNERRILASLEHPNIARLMDGGVLADGRPWFAMEFVDGETLIRWCDRQALPVAERLRLFIQVCRAVLSAHARLVIHRDLKPSNILVTEQDQVKLLDFGIAKLLDTDGETGVDLTRLGATVMTPEYAAPEQIEGGPVSVATDVYALGVVLYELLSGQHPYREEATTREQLTDAIRESRPVLPSARLAQGRSDSPVASRQLSGDLDAIVLTAMAGSVEDRYASVEALAEDIQRHLEGLPVRARARSRSYRLGRFLSRYRVAVSAVAAVVIALSAGLGVATWQAREAGYQAQLAEQTRDFVLSLLQQSNPGRNEEGFELRAVDLLQAAADRVESAVDLEPLMQGRLALVLADGLLELGARDRAMELALLGIGRIERSRDQGGDQDDALLASGLYVLARTQVNQGQSQDAEQSARRALDLLDALTDLNDDDRFLRIQLLEVLAHRFGNSLAAGHQSLFYERALNERVALFGAEDASVAPAHYGLAVALQGAGDFDGAVEHLQEAMALLARQSPDHPRMANIHLGIGSAQLGQGRLEAAEASLLLAMQLAEERLGPGATVIRTARARLGHLYRYQLAFDQAHSWFESAATRSDVEQADLRETVALSWLGTTALSQGQADEAFTHFKRSKSLLQALGHQSHPQYSIAVLGEALARYRTNSEAPELARLESVMGVLLAADSGASQAHGEGAELMGALLRDLEQDEAAERWLSDARTRFASHFGAQHPRTLAVGRLYDPSSQVATR